MSDGIDVWIDDPGGNETRVFKARAVRFNTVDADSTTCTPSAFIRGAAKIEGDLKLEPGPGWDGFVEKINRSVDEIKEAGRAWVLQNIVKPMGMLFWESLVEGYVTWPADEGQKRLAIGIAVERFRTTTETFDDCALHACHRVHFGQMQSDWIIEGGRRALRERVREIRGW